MSDFSIITSYFPDLSDEQKRQFEMLGHLYEEWNQKINVISRKDIEELYVRHVLHSLAISKFTGFAPGSEIIDIGTGGGFPGIPLAIMYPESQFLLVDSIGKKIKVVNAVIEEAGISNAVGEHVRAEKVKKQFDFVVTRAVARSKQLWNWSHQLVSRNSTNTIENGIIALKGGNLRDELKELKRPYQEIAIADFFDQDFFDTKKIIYIPR